MQKILFLEPAELKQGDGLGPKWAAGKAYWLSNDQAWRWKGEGVAIDAPGDMKAENELAAEPLRPDAVRIVRNGRYRWDVLGPADHKFNEEPLTAAEAEKLRQRVLAAPPAAAPVAAAELPIAPPPAEPEPQPEPPSEQTPPA